MTGARCDYAIMTINQEKEVTMPYGWKIRAILDEKGMTQADLARASGIDASNISYIVNQDRNVREKTLWRLCKGLNCKPEDIMLEEE